MRRPLHVLLVCSCLALIGAGAPHPAPSPSPSPSATPLPIAPSPVVVVYPFDTTGQLKPNVGIGIAQVFTQQMNEAGGLTILPVPDAVHRTDFLTNATKEHADFYISGYMTPIGDGAAVVVQVVSASSGIIVFSNTQQAYSMNDVATQAQQAREAILEISGRGTDASDTQTANATPAPTSTNGASVNVGGLGNLVSNLFHKGSKASPAPGPGATPHVKPSRGVIVAHVLPGTGANASQAATATGALASAMGPYFTTTTTSADDSAMATAADAICGNNRDNTIAAGSLATGSSGHMLHSGTDYAFTLTIYTCFGATLYQNTVHGGDLGATVNAAVKAYAADHPTNN